MSPLAEFFELGAFVAGLTEMVKRVLLLFYLAFDFSDETISEINNALMPIVSVAFGMLVNIYLWGYTQENLLYGAVTGLTVSGLYAASKSIMK